MRHGFLIEEEDARQVVQRALRAGSDKALELPFARIGLVGARAVQKACASLSVTRIDLRGNDVLPEGAHEIVKLLPFECDIARSRTTLVC